MGQYLQTVGHVFPTDSQSWVLEPVAVKQYQPGLYQD